VQFSELHLHFAVVSKTSCFYPLIKIYLHQKADCASGCAIRLAKGSYNQAFATQRLITEWEAIT